MDYESRKIKYEKKRCFIESTGCFVKHLLNEDGNLEWFLLDRKQLELGDKIFKYIDCEGKTKPVFDDWIKDEDQRRKSVFGFIPYGEDENYIELNYLFNTFKGFRAKRSRLPHTVHKDIFKNIIYNDKERDETFYKFLHDGICDYDDKLYEYLYKHNEYYY